MILSDWLGFKIKKDWSSNSIIIKKLETLRYKSNYNNYILSTKYAPVSELNALHLSHLKFIVHLWDGYY